MATNPGRRWLTAPPGGAVVALVSERSPVADHLRCSPNESAGTTMCAGRHSAVALTADQPLGVVSRSVCRS